MAYKVEIPPKKADSQLTGGSPISKIPERPVRTGKEGPEDDPILPVGAWYPVFKEFHRKVVHETRDFDYGWVRAHRLDLYRSLKAKEAELDSLRDARLSEVMAVMREWRTLILKSEFERMEANKPQPEQEKLNVMD